jgi:hypothetical protein
MPCPRFRRRIPLGNLEEASLEDRRHAQLGAATGILWALLVVLGALVVIPAPPEVKDAPEAWAQYFVDHRGAIQFGNALIAVGVFFYIWFLGSLRSYLRAAEGGAGRLSNIAFGAGIASTGFVFIALAAAFTAALRPDEISPELVRTLNDVGVVAGGATVGAYAALFFATALVAHRFGALTPRIAWVSAICGLLQFVALGMAVNDSGAFSIDEAGGVVPLIAFIVAILAISIRMIRDAAGPASASTSLS